MIIDNILLGMVVIAAVVLLVKLLELIFWIIVLGSEIFLEMLKGRLAFSDTNGYGFLIAIMGLFSFIALIAYLGSLVQH